MVIKKRGRYRNQYTILKSAISFHINTVQLHFIKLFLYLFFANRSPTRLGIPAGVGNKEKKYIIWNKLVYEMTLHKMIDISLNSLCCKNDGPTDKVNYILDAL